MFTVSARVLDALRGSHTAVVNVDAYVGSTLVAANLPVTGGSVVVDAGSAVRRQLNLSVADLSLLPTNPDLSAPFGLELRVSRGVRFADGTTEMVPLGTFRVDVSHRAAGGVVEVTGPDRAKAIIDAKFLSPAVSTLGATVVAEMTRLVQEVLATVTVNNVNVDPTLITPYLVWASERWSAAQDLATASGAQIFFAPDGSLTIQKVPSITSPVAWFVNAGADGVLITYSKAVTREETYNGVVAMGERADGVSPARAVALDTDPSSPTVWGGPFGKVPFFFTSPIITTPAGAQRAADGLLAIKRALGRSVSLTAIVNPALDAGDVIGVRLPDGTLERYLVDRLTVPLDPRSPLLIEARTGSPTLVITDLPATAPTADPYPTPATPDPYPASLPSPLAPAPLPIPLPILPLPDPAFGGPGQPLPPLLLPTTPYTSDFPPPPGTDPSFGVPTTQTYVAKGPGNGPPANRTVWRPNAVTHPATARFPGGVEATFGQPVTGLVVDDATTGISASRWYLPIAVPAYDNTGPDRFGFLLDYVRPDNLINSTSGSGIIQQVGRVAFALIPVDFAGLPGAPSGIRVSVAEAAGYTSPFYWGIYPGEVRTDETFFLRYLPRTVNPEVEVRLGGVLLDPAENKYDIDYLTGLFTIRPSMNVVTGQKLQVTYTSNGVPPGGSPP